MGVEKADLQVTGIWGLRTRASSKLMPRFLVKGKEEMTASPLVIEGTGDRARFL